MPAALTNLRRQLALLQTAIAACREDPGPKPIHKLRTTTRRIEATLELLTLLTDPAELRLAVKPLRKSTRTLRRLAGGVRDIDVNRKTLELFTNNPDAAILDKHLKQERKKAARELQGHLAKEHRKLQKALDPLMQALPPAAKQNLDGAKLAHMAQCWLTTAIRGLDPADDVQLHSIRKACKTARYIVEISGLRAKAASRLANRFTRIQQAAGDWHDSLLLLQQAHSVLHADSTLLKRLEADCKRKRRRAEPLARRILLSVA
jgi:CHAD domain-containing protein